MKTKAILVLSLVVGLILLAGCETQSNNSPPPSGPIGGGCGVAAPNSIDDNSNYVKIPSEKNIDLIL